MYKVVDVLLKKLHFADFKKMQSIFQNQSAKDKFSDSLVLLKTWSAFTEGETPVPIPNTVVKPLRADGTLVVRLRESRSALLK